MRLIRGVGGRVLLASDPLPFTAEPLSDAGDGFEWRVADPTRRLLCEMPLLFEASLAGGAWGPLEPLEVHHLTGRVGFGRCLRAHAVRATGVCRPLAQVANAEKWELRVEVAVSDTTAFGDEVETLETKNDRTAVAELTNCALEPFLAPELDTSDLLVLLPFRRSVFAGVGGRVASPDTSTVKVNFHEGSVSYVVC